MRRTAIMLFAVMAITLLSCGDKAPATEKVVATTAKLYYDYLLEEKYDDFVGGIDLSFPKSEKYTEQMRDCAKMFVARQKEIHQGIKAVDAVNAEVDDDAHSANAFLVLHYSDSTSEQVVVPMVERNGVWLMR